MRRLVCSVPPALIVTVGLFLGMRILVEGSGRSTLNDSASPFRDLIRLPTKHVMHAPPRTMPNKPQPQATPARAAPALGTRSPRPGRLNTPSPFAAYARGNSLSFKPIGGLGRITRSENAEATPLIRVNPLYPRRAAERGIEGYVTVRFMVGTTGQVVDPKIIASNPPGVFDRTALKAVRKWKYRPKIVDGTPLQYGVNPVKLEFRL